MDEKKKHEKAVRLSLIDVMYGVVLAYGFNFLDQARYWQDYFRFFLAYAVFIYDFVYVHRLYWGWEYNNSFLLLDIGVLFTISRLIFTSTANTPYYFMWFSALFIFYVLWDIISMVKKFPSQYDWRYGTAGDFIGSIMFLVLWILSLKGLMQTNDIFWTAGPIIVCLIALLSSLKKAPELQPKNI